jgi:hypothetical protein
MEQVSEPKRPTGAGKRRGRGGKQRRRVAIEDRVLSAAVPAGSRFKGYESFLIQDLFFGRSPFATGASAGWTPDGRTVVAPLPAGIDGHFGSELRRFVLAQYHQRQVSVLRLVALLEAIGIEVSKRQVVRLLIGRQGRFLDEARERRHPQRPRPRLPGRLPRPRQDLRQARHLVLGIISAPG